MLIEFRVSNFRSIKEEQVFSMVASKSGELEDSHTFTVSGFKERLLRSAAVYGANASGKTNLLRALHAMQTVVLKSHQEKSQGDSIAVVPFKLNLQSINLPSKFEVVFISGGVRYQYGFSATTERITEECLLAFPKGRTQQWFKREWDGDKYKWSFGASLKGERKVWKQSTRDNALFLSTAVHLNSQQLQPVYDWFKDTLHLSIGLESFLMKDPMGKSMWENLDCDEIGRFLQGADLGVDAFRIEKQKFRPEDLEDLPDVLPDGMKRILKQALAQEMQGKDLYDVRTLHRNSEGEEVEFDLIKEESAGTINAFFLAIIFVESLQKGHVVFIDEFHNSLHPLLVKFFTGLFNDGEKNTGNAQLVFTTHETSMLNQEILRRDQIWFCEKNTEQATQVYPLSDFRPRKGRENLELGYLSGRYGALPYIRESH